MREARFPADGTAADASGLAGAKALAGAFPDGEAWTSPSRAARETCAALGLDALPVAALAEADYGRWAGVRYADVDPDALAGWLSAPDTAPHGGESRNQAAARSRSGSAAYRPGSRCATRAPSGPHSATPSAWTSRRPTASTSRRCPPRD